MNVGRTPTELYDEMQPDYSASGMYLAHLGSRDRWGIRGLIPDFKNSFSLLRSVDPCEPNFTI